jgi:sortase A
MQASARAGSAIGRIQIPAIRASFVLIDGTGTSELELGPGVYSDVSYPGVSFPGESGTTAIAGHRTTWLEPFRDINELRRGDRIIVTMPYAKLTYSVLSQKAVLPTDVRAAIAGVPGPPRLVLSACTPPFSAEKRLLVYARLTATRPRGAALRVRTRPVGGMLSVFADAAQALPAIGARSRRASPAARRS